MPGRHTADATATPRPPARPMAGSTRRERPAAGLDAVVPGRRALSASAYGLLAADGLFFVLLWRTVVHAAHPLWLHAVVLSIGAATLACAYGSTRACSARTGSRPWRRALVLAPAGITSLALTELAVHRLGDEVRLPAWAAFAFAAACGLLLGEARGARAGRVPAARLGVAAAAVVSTATACSAFFGVATEPGLLPLGPARRPPAAGDAAAPRIVRYAALDPGAAPSATESVTSRSVDARALLAGWSGFNGWLRTRTFGFGPDALPLDGQVWLPADDRDAPHPLVLVAHGNHPMEAPSHLGFEYLCDALARRGYACVSIDLRFLNASYLADALGGLEGDRVVRAWMLLAHLDQLRTWSRTGGHRLAGRIDTDQVGLIGHSRGGAVVAMAAEWNALRRIPVRPGIPLPEVFGIRSVTALAPIEVLREDRRGDRLPALAGQSYLVLHGGRDADVRAFEGSLQWERTRVDHAPDASKLALHIARANHNHFNSDWDPGDKPLLLAPLVERGQTLDGDTQRRVTVEIVSRFLDAVHRGSRADRDWLRDPDALARALGAGAIVHRYRDGRTFMLADFDEDDDPTTAGLRGARITTTDMALAREEYTEGRWQGNASASRALRLTWSGGPASPSPRFALTLPDDTEGLGEGDALVIDLATDRGVPCAGEPFDVVVELADDRGRLARARLAALHPTDCEALDGPYHAALLNPRPEILFSTRRLERADFVPDSPEFDAARLRAIRLLLDGRRAGTLLVDAIGIRRVSS